MTDPVVLPDWPRGMRIELAASYLGISPSLLRAELVAGRFPAPVRISPGRVVWLKEDLDRWLDAKAGRPNARAEAASDADAPSDWDREFGDGRAA
jgi:predicted DNA-binding transcriptional regulator AlpA